MDSEFQFNFFKFWPFSSNVTTKFTHRHYGLQKLLAIVVVGVDTKSRYSDVFYIHGEFSDFSTKYPKSAKTVSGKNLEVFSPQLWS